MKSSCAPLTAMLVIAALLLGIGCSIDPPRPLIPDWSTGRDDFGYLPPKDFRPPADFSWSPSDAGPADASTDGTVFSDGGGCHEPKSTSCSKPCGANELCTAASGGTCAQQVVLSGKATSKPVLLAVALAYVDCWEKNPSDDTLCATFDTCALEGSLGEAAIKTWVCNDAQIVDFPNSDVYDSARSVCGCALYQIYRPNWQISTLATNERALTCLGYDKGPIYYPDRLMVHDCTSFPYP